MMSSSSGVWLAQTETANGYLPFWKQWWISELKFAVFLCQWLDWEASGNAEENTTDVRNVRRQLLPMATLSKHMQWYILHIQTQCSAYLLCHKSGAYMKTRFPEVVRSSCRDILVWIFSHNSHFLCGDFLALCSCYYLITRRARMFCVIFLSIWIAMHTTLLCLTAKEASTVVPRTNATILYMDSCPGARIVQCGLSALT